MALNAHSTFDSDTETFLPANSFSAIPGSVDGPTSLLTMFLFSGLLGVFLFSCDLFQRPIWRKRVWVTVALAGLSIAAFGIVQKIGGDPVLALLWEPEKRDIANNFAAFRYRGNAGAFLNLVLPLLAGLTFVNFQRRDRHWAKAGWVAALFIVAAGIQLNPSRASWGIAIGLGLVLAGKTFWHYWRRREDGAQSKVVLSYTAIIAALLLAIGGIAVLGGWETSLRRAGKVGLSPAGRSPTQIYLEMIPDAGATGFGPGTFRAIFATYQRDYDYAGHNYLLSWKSGLWHHAHQDYLQTLIEWGWLGTLCWAVLILGGVARGVMQYVRLKSEFSLRWLVLCSLLGLGGVLTHAWIDFPLQIASIQLYACVLLAVCWSARSESSRVASSRIS